MWWFLKLDKVRNILHPKDPDGHFSKIKDKIVQEILSWYIQLLSEGLTQIGSLHKVF
ncbi:MAG TPA: hypothetical protein PJ990_15205 [Saprospiraceae bacterium]|nr:hypothetical protein [Saprospiraceae bacterium]